MADMVMGVDSSTQSTKVEVRDLVHGRVVASASASHPPTHPPVSEQDPMLWWEALVEACSAIESEIRADIAAVSVAGQQHGLVVLDAGGHNLRPAKLWNDTTSAPQAAAMVDRFGPTAWARATGSLPVAAFTISKLAWLAEHEPEHLDSVDRVMLPHDYLTLRLCGRHVTDRGDASGTGWFDPVTGAYRPELFEMAGLDGSRWVPRLPTVLEPTQAAGEITAEAAEVLGLRQGVVIAPGSGDNMGAALGLGLQPGDVTVSLGTSGVAYARSHTPTHDATGIVAGFADATGGYLPLVCTLNATKVTDVVARWLGTDPAGLAELALEIESTDVAVIPWFDGERTPNRPDATGTIVGLRTDTDRREIALAAHDGVLCGLLNGIDALASCGVDVSGTLHLIGGGGRSPAYRQRCADLWGRPIIVPDADETVATGAAVQAAVVLEAADFASVQQRWNLGRGHEVSPRLGIDGAEIRRRHDERTAGP